VDILSVDSIPRINSIDVDVVDRNIVLVLIMILYGKDYIEFSVYDPLLLFFQCIAMSLLFLFIIIRIPRRHRSIAKIKLSAKYIIRLYDMVALLLISDLCLYTLRLCGGNWNLLLKFPLLSRISFIICKELLVGANSFQANLT